MYISTIPFKEHIERKRPFVMAVFLGVGLLAAQGWTSLASPQPDGGVLGGPAPEAASGGSLAALTGQPLVKEFDLNDALTVRDERFLTAQGSVASAGSPLGLTSGQGAVATYTVRKGDTLSKIAADFGVSVQTIIGSNPEVKNRPLQVGQDLSVLPVSGILYRVRDEETAESIAASFHLTITQLKEFNRSVDLGKIGSGSVLVIPGASPYDAAALDTRGAELPNLREYFSLPADGFNWGRLHRSNAVDIANACGSPVRAAAEGLVIDESIDDWSYGYGHFVLIAHPNGTKTRYAHMAKLLASVGDYVDQGDQIGTMGDTGEATGCHLHFEVHDARNPFARQ